MKKILMMAVATVMTVAAMGQQPVLTLISADTHDFGKINEADGRVSTVFEFKNEGMAPLVLSNVRASCGCTTPKWTREPIEPGQTGQITVTYNPNGRPGRFQKTVTITSNASEATKRVYIKGEVIPKPAKPVDKYPVKMGKLGLQKNSLDFGNVNMGEFKEMSIEYANQGTENLQVAVFAYDEDAYFNPTATLEEVKPNETGQVKATLATTSANTYGPVQATVYVVVNNKPELNNTYAITLKGNITEDFSHLTPEQLQAAPIMEVTKEVNIGTVKQGKKISYKLALNNAGVNPLLIRRVLMDEVPGLSIIQPKGAIKGGKKGEIRLDINTAVKGQEPVAAGSYGRTMTLITNDPNNPVVTVHLNWVVE